MTGRAERPFVWTAEHVEGIATTPHCSAPLIGVNDFTRIADDLDIWDAWPIQEPGGLPALLPDRSSLWMALGAPCDPDPDKRHGQARIHLLQRHGETWRHLGAAMPDGFSPGSREWSGSAVLDAEAAQVVLYFTATGTRREATASFEQRIFRAKATLGIADDRPRLVDWRGLEEIVRPDPAHYMASNAGTGAIGTIKAFRDPAYFRDPVDGASYLLFAGSAAHSQSDFNGIVGAAVAEPQTPDLWRILPPVVSADGLNNELERPHVVLRNGLYYLFWSTQRHVFDPSGPAGPTGLYGVVGAQLAGPWEPLNGTGLVFANPPEAPYQAYSWLVLPSLEVISFVDDWRAPDEPDQVRKFGGAFAPVLRLALNGAKAELVT